MTGINPITKVVMLASFSFLVVLISDPVHMMICVGIVLAAKEKFRTRGIVTKGIIGFALAIFLAQVIFVHNGEEVFRVYFIEVSTGGVFTGITIAGKFLSLVMMSWVFVATTTPSKLSSAFTTAGFPYRYAFLPALAMRFVPVFQFELATVREAQSSRGMRLDKSLRGIARSARYTTVPMLMTAMSKVNSLAASMTGRGFGIDRKRTLLNPMPMTGPDYALSFATIILVAITILVSRCPEVQFV